VTYLLTYLLNGSTFLSELSGQGPKVDVTHSRHDASNVFVIG